MASKYDWEFIKPLDQTANIVAMSSGNQQMLAGLQGMGTAVTGLADHYKQRNTDDILNTLMQAQTTQDLPNAMSAVQALQQQYGRGYDQAKVREAIDTRGTTLGQRDLQNINLQQAQAAQAAIPEINQAFADEAIRQGASADVINRLSGLGINAQSMLSSLGSNARSEAIDTRDYTDRRNDINYQRQYQTERDRVSDFYQEEGNNRANLATAGQVASLYETPAQSGYVTNPDGTISTYSSPGVTKGSAFSAIMGSLFQTESNMRHRNKDGSLVTSPKGAQGIAQIMPATAAKPGYGMKPIDLKNTTPEQQMAWSEEYINKIAAHHKFTVPQAVAAYNAGAGKVEKAIKSNGANWLAALPKETRNYVPKVLNGAQGASGAMAAVGGGVSQANMSKVSSGYQNAIAKLSADFEAETVKSQTKGSLAATGKSLDTWAATKKDNGIVFAGNNSWFTSASDLVGMAKKDPTFKDLPETAQMNILEGAYAKMNDVNKLQYVPDGDLQKFISNEAKSYHTNRKAAFTQAKEAAFESSYQSMVQQFQAIGAAPPSREGARQLLDPTYKPEAQPKPDVPAAKPEAKPQAKASTPTPTPAAAAVAAVKPAKEKAANTPPPAKPDKQAIVDFMVKRGPNLFPSGLDGTKDKALIREAAAEARKVIADNKAKAEQAKKDKADAYRKKSTAEVDRLRKEYAAKQAAKIAAERKKLEEQKKNSNKFYGLV